MNRKLTPLVRWELLLRSIDVEPRPLAPMELPAWVAAAAPDLLLCRSPNRLVLPRMAPRLDPAPVAELPGEEEEDDEDEAFDPPVLPLALLLD